MCAPRAPSIADHAVIGDQRTAALVATDGSIDFLCWPRFDSPSVFVGLLDPERGGHWRIAPRLPGAHVRQRYLPETNVLSTRWFGDGAIAEIRDFMPIGPRDRRGLIRCVKAQRGEVTFDLELAPRFDYARAQHTAHLDPDSSVRFATDQLALRLRADVPIRVDGGDARATFTLPADRAVWFVLEPADAGHALWPDAASRERAYDDTVAYWRSWIERSRYRGRWQEIVHRSALLVKLMQHVDYGGIIAAPTFALPEALGGPRNWDYRFVWIRDACFALHALSRLGLEEESIKFLDWLTHGCQHPTGGKGPPLRVLYRVDGTTETTETSLPHLSGYRGSRPVRIGNGAGDQLQLDIFGELFETVAQYERPEGQTMHHETWDLLSECAEWVAHHWNQPDDGIWEIRGGRRDFLSSRVMCWAALDRAIHLSVRSSMPAPIRRWHDERDKIFHEVRTRFWNKPLGAFTETPGAGVVDASSLLMPRVGIIAATDPCWTRHMRVVDEQLVEDTTVYRYPPGADVDGINAPEGTFSVCSFWFIEALTKAGHLGRARVMFDDMLGFANHVGLYAEELGQSMEPLGNFPQVLTHLGLISAAVTLDRALEVTCGVRR